MAFWARVMSGIVQEPARELPDGHEPSEYFPDALPGTWMTAPDGSPQSGWTYADGVYAAPVIPDPSVAQQAEQAISAGLTVQSTSTPAISGAYKITPDMQAKIVAVSVYIAINAKFPGGTTTYGWPDVDGNMHVFPDIETFKAWATAVADRVSQLEQIAITNSGAIPNPTVTIA